MTTEIDWVTVQQAAEIAQCSTKTIRRRISEGTLPAKRFGPRLIRIERASLADAPKRFN